ncbi:MAG TPA: ABC transporter permease [Halieaceae bacterium]|nr:ABC transporter permease [Halieaceae bacterium]
MKAIYILAVNEFLDGLRSRWVAAAIILLGAMALTLLLVGSAPSGVTRAGALAISVVSLASLSVYLLPLIALMLSFDALVGEFERGTMLLLLTYPVSRWHVVMGKFFGHIMILAAAIVIGYGGAALVTIFSTEDGIAGWQAYLAMMGSSLLLGAIFVALGYMVSVLVRERTTAAGAAVGLWLILVVLYDLGLLGMLLADNEQRISQSVFSFLMLANPTDTYRILNMTAFDTVGQAAGVAGVAARLEFSVHLLLSLLIGWVTVPLLATIAIFHRREL